jgi:hypothetical protein
VNESCRRFFTTVRRVQRCLAPMWGSQNRSAAFNEIEIRRLLTNTAKNISGRKVHSLHDANDPRQRKTGEP